MKTHSCIAIFPPLSFTVLIADNQRVLAEEYANEIAQRIEFRRDYLITHFCWAIHYILWSLVSAFQSKGNPDENQIESLTEFRNNKTKYG